MRDKGGFAWLGGFTKVNACEPGPAAARASLDRGNPGLVENRAGHNGAGFAGRGWDTMRDGVPKVIYKGIDLFGVERTAEFSAEPRHQGAGFPRGDPLFPIGLVGGMIERMEVGDHGGAVFGFVADGAGGGEEFLAGFSARGISVAMGASVVLEDFLAIHHGDLLVSKALHLPIFGQHELDGEQLWVAAAEVNGDGLEDGAGLAGKVDGDIDLAIFMRFKDPRLAGDLGDRAAAGSLDTLNDGVRSRNVGGAEEELGLGFTRLGRMLLDEGIPRELLGARRDGWRDVRLGGRGKVGGFPLGEAAVEQPLRRHKNC